MNYNRERKKCILMIGPDLEGMGGISQVIKIWKVSKIFDEHNIKYIPTASNLKKFYKIINLLQSIFIFVFLSFKNCRGVYIHTASRNSFYRKLIFIIISITLSKKIILHIHPTLFYTFIINLKGIKKICIHFLLKKIFKYVVLTNQMAENIRRLFPDKEIHVLRNPINFEAMKNKNNVTRKNKRLLFLGWYTRFKGIYDLIDAMKIISEQCYDVKLNMFGTYNIEKLKDYVKKNNLDNVIVHGWINDNEKLDILYKSTMLILPSYSEGIPNVILEAMATKTPIVTTGVGGQKEILTHHKNALIVKPKNPLDLSKNIMELIENENLREKIATDAFNLAKENFDIKIIKKQIGEILDISL